MIIEEGSAKIYAPTVNLKGPGKIEGIFYNREMVFNRDTTIFLLYNLKIRNALDGMAATGVRGIRIIKECGIDTVLNDKNFEAVKIIKKNLELNEIRGRVENRNVNALMAEEKFDYIDIDPFGTPVPYIDMAILSGKILGITATDTATLAGRNRRVERRYLSNLRSPSHLAHELGVRNLLGYVARMAARFDRGIAPILSIWYKHFYRVYVRILPGTSKAKDTLKNVDYCEFGGPIWMGPLHEFSFLFQAKIPPNLPSEKVLRKYLEIWKQEKFFLYYHLPFLSKKLRISTPSPKVVMEKLKEKGYEAYPTQFSSQGVRTNASLQEIKNILLSVSSKYT